MASEPASPMHEQDLVWMRRAIELARVAIQYDEVPVAALVVKEGRLVTQAHNLRETQRDPTAHAERLALTQAGEILRNWYLEKCTVYVTLEPCLMCAGALVLARVDRVVYGALDAKAGACESLYRILEDGRLNHRPEVVSGVLAKECGDLLTEFFRAKRSATRRLKGMDGQRESGATC